MFPTRALDAGDTNAVAGVGDIPDHDQRGQPFDRIDGGRIDIGAFEFQLDGVVEVDSMSIDNGTGQRSMVRSLTIKF